MARITAVTQVNRKGSESSPPGKEYIMKKPTKCTTPKKDRDAYRLTKKDIHNLTKLVSEASQILTYYTLMPENRTAELEANDSVIFDHLYEATEDLLQQLGEITLV